MKKLKGLFVFVMVFTILLGNLGFKDNDSTISMAYDGGYTTNQEPNPVAS